MTDRSNHGETVEHGTARMAFAREPAPLAPVQRSLDGHPTDRRATDRRAADRRAADRRAADLHPVEQLRAEQEQADPGQGPADRGHRVLLASALFVTDLCALSLTVLWWPHQVVPDWAYVADWGYVVAALVFLSLSGAYRPRITLAALLHAPQHLPALGLALLLMTPLAQTPARNEDLPLHALWSVPCFLAGRTVVYAVIRWARCKRFIEEPALVVGGGRLAMALLTVMEDHPEYGLRPVGYLTNGDPLGEPAPLGRTADVDAVLTAHGVRKIIVAYGVTREADLVSLVRSAAQHDVEVYVVPRFFDVGMSHGGSQVEDLWGIPLHRVRRSALHWRRWYLKRLLDIVVSATALLVLSPLFAVLALAVRFSSPGPVLYRQVRTGRSGHQLCMLKFRTLRVAPPEPPADADGTGTTEATMNARQRDVEDRQTRIGSLLRRTSLDELPQLWNVLRGDMSLVGPRPEECGYAAQFTDSVSGYGDRHRLVVGLTGWAQVHGLRGDTSIHDRVRFDNHYIEYWSLWGDLVILGRTVGAVVRQALTSVRK
jgi:exopolysaccharide biosynthesis polyprenyl glycosylphosphotransferase